MSPTDGVPNDALSPLFVAVADATEEAIYDSLLMANTIVRDASASGPAFTGGAIDVARVKAILGKHGIHGAHP